ncbi:MAG: transposase [Deltaproteobacteria bacterium]|nr:transposase [Deltaproteobacteria bacterium]
MLRRGDAPRASAGSSAPGLRAAPDGDDLHLHRQVSDVQADGPRAAGRLPGRRALAGVGLEPRAGDQCLARRPDKEARAEARKAEIANLDETGWFQGTADGRARRAWLWVAVTAMVTVFKIAFSRGDNVAKEMLGEDWRGLLGSDRWSGYLWVPAKLRQLCWSHL